MKALKDRLLLASSDSNLFSQIKVDLKKSFEVQFANAPDMLSFLCQQWEPNVLIVDAENSELVNASSAERHKPTHASLGLIAVSRIADLKVEESVFKAGFDHHLVMPLESRQLEWRIQALIRKKGQSPSERGLVTLPGIRVYPSNSMVKRHDTPVTISPIQFRLLVTFLSHPDQLLTRDWLKTHVWSDAPISSRTIDAQISKLKRVIPELENCLMNIYGKGYVLSPARQKAA